MKSSLCAVPVAGCRKLLFTICIVIIDILVAYGTIMKIYTTVFIL